MYLAVVDYQKKFETFCKVIGHPELLEDPRFNTQEAYYKNKGPLTEILEKVFVTKSIPYWDELFDKNDLPHEVCRHFKDVPYDPQVQANHYAYFHEYPDGTKTVFTNGPVHFGSVEPSEIPCREPGNIGRDSGEILKELGYTEEEVNGMFVDGSAKQ